MRIALATWPADYGSPVGDGALEETTTVVDTAVEERGVWAPRRVTVPPASVVWFVDGVRRMEARAWLIDDDGSTTPGLVASWAAGAVRCNNFARLSAKHAAEPSGPRNKAVIERCKVRRGLFSASEDGPGLITEDDTMVFLACHAHADTDAGLRNALQAAMRAMEFDVARGIGDLEDLIFLDGPVRGRTRGRTVGYIKTQQVAYLPQALRATVEQLEVGQRTPLFLTSSENWQHWSWYLRLSKDGQHPWEAVARCEVPKEGIDLPAAVALADEATASLPRFASRPHRDARAPQNLYPIGGLERFLRHRLGEGALIARHLRRAVATR